MSEEQAEYAVAVHPQRVGVWVPERDNLAMALAEEDYYIEAVATWSKVNRDLKHFAECCAGVRAGRTAALAADCKCSVDTIENYRRAWLLYNNVRHDEEVSPSELARMWEVGSAALWVKAAQLETRLDISREKVLGYLQIAIDEKMTREQMAAHVDTKENNTPQWLRRLRRIVGLLASSRDDWKTEMPAEVRKEYEAIVTEFAARLEALTK